MTEKRREIHDWEELYQKEPVENLPWFYEKIDHDFANALTQWNITTGHILDLGTGPGTQAIALAKMGLTVTATDISETAIEKAKQRSQEMDCQVDFLKDDILNTQLDKTFKLVLDRGCFHTLHSEQRQDFIKAVYNLIEPKGYLFLKCFSHLETREEGPYRFTPEELTSYFASQFKIHSISETVFHGTLEDFPKALFCVMEKV
jgi:2-polyprenyl-3-methyl-5-hydroxy-6-metoxy-1,4-benzoquinol methylase